MLKTKKAKTVKAKVSARAKPEKSQAELSIVDASKVAPTLDGAGIPKMSKKPYRIMNIRKFEDRSVKIYVQDGSHHVVTHEWCSIEHPKVNDYIMLQNGKLVCMTRDAAIPLSK